MAELLPVKTSALCFQIKSQTEQAGTKLQGPIWNRKKLSSKCKFRQLPIK